jgi:predicted AAA+ superfamily ATPase
VSSANLVSMESSTLQRYLTEPINTLALKRHKIVYISGPRQVGKTSLSKRFLDERSNGAYWNWDSLDFKRLWAKSPASIVAALNRSPTPIVILDEIHKSKRWKGALKGVYDTVPFPIDFIVTGSARLDTFRRGSDSLLGRYLPFRLHPFSLRELLAAKDSYVAPTPDGFLESIRKGEFNSDSKRTERELNRLNTFGGFPEPLFSADPDFLRSWRQTRLEAIVREDLRDLTRLPELDQVQLLAALLPERAGSQLSRAALREDLQVAHTTISRWLKYLEAVYYFYEIRPYSTSIKRSLLREGKLYLWDWSEVADDGHRFENVVAGHLLKACHFWTDAGKGLFELRYLRNKEGYEVDFLITRDRKPWLPVEVKLSDTSLSDSWRVFLPQIKCKVALQLVATPKINTVARQGDTTIYTVSASSALSSLV